MERRTKEQMIEDSRADLTEEKFISHIWQNGGKNHYFKVCIDKSRYVPKKIQRYFTSLDEALAFRDSIADVYDIRLDNPYGCFNRHRINSDGTVTIFIESKGAVYQCLIDLEDLEKVSGHRWSLHRGYVRTTFNGKTLFLHHIICPNVDTSKYQTDHISRNPLDNRKINLRVVTQEVNNMNQLHKFYANAWNCFDACNTLAIDYVSGGEQLEQK